MVWFTDAAAKRERMRWEALDRSLAWIEFSPEGVIRAANASFCALMGFAETEIVGKPHRTFMPPADADAEAYREFWRKLAAGEAHVGLFKRRRKDGATVYLRGAYAPMRDAHGRVVGVVKSASDVTEARLDALANDARMAALSRVQAIIEFKPSGEVLDCNDNFCAAMGYAREEVVGRPHAMFVDPAFAATDEYRAFWRRLGAGEAIVNSFHRLGKNGRPIWLQASYNPVLDLEGRVYKVVKFATDISDLSRLGEALAKLSAGDLRQRLDAPFSSTFDRLRVDFNHATQQLNGLLRGIVAAIGAVSEGTAEISSASRDLSQRTEAQAANLEQTAAALEQVTVTVRHGADSARLANGVVGEAKEEAEKGGAIVGRAVEAMGRIENSSDEIGKIIGVIDEIAFQTNLLALNAGVEAARAGDAGRGFAVVASEVRALAQRSADAARQIKTLISTSGADVEAGVKLVRSTGEALGAIVAKVMEVNTLVGGIAGAAAEQNSALAEVNIAVSAMDQSTQQNAAMAEEANAAVESMKTQIAKLSASIGDFQLAGDAPARRWAA